MLDATTLYLSKHITLSSRSSISHKPSFTGPLATKVNTLCSKFSFVCYRCFSIENYLDATALTLHCQVVFLHKTSFTGNLHAIAASNTVQNNGVLPVTLSSSKGLSSRSVHSVTLGSIGKSR